MATESVLALILTCQIRFLLIGEIPVKFKKQVSIRHLKGKVPFENPPAFQFVCENRCGPFRGSSRSDLAIIVRHNHSGECFKTFAKRY